MMHLTIMKYKIFVTPLKNGRYSAGYTLYTGNKLKHTESECYPLDTTYETEKAATQAMEEWLKKHKKFC